ncbi:MAG: protein kinase [Chloroflexus sp.]|uniref:serine/threonine-protein kinase n=1 Tax=Chloroflexus sp. TaxID=1904827 RepID=UPI0021DBBFAD|nr:serine/threonine-protein kinase [Chloroflexus sp.]GIV89682.1 MAG: protein kinase [Chloroflexus sp.]
MSDVSLVGQTLGRFEILSELGRGGMAVVYKARQTDLDRIVALKILPPGLTSDQSYIARFRQEARSAARLEHPHIMPIYEVGEVAGYHYIAMKFIQGRTLKQLLQQEGALSVRRAAQILAQVGEALDYAHRQGIIHRDIKPSNVMITDEGWVYLTDFGLARGTGSNSGLTIAGTVMGTPEYMSPEQAQGLPNVGPPTDIYALGVMLYELLTGAFPFKAETPMAMLAARLVHAPIPPRDVRSDLPPAVEDVIMRALARKPEARFATAAEMVAALRQAVGMSESELNRPLTPQRGMPAIGSGLPSPLPTQPAPPLPPTQPASPPPAHSPTTPSPAYVQTPPAPASYPYAAAPTTPAPHPLNVPAPPARSTGKGPLVGILVGVIALGLLIGGGIALFVLFRPSSPTPTSLTDTTASFISTGDTALARAGGLAEAIEAYRKAVATNSDDMTAHARLAGALLAQGSWSEAIAATDPLINATDSRAQAIGLGIRGYAYLHLGNRVQARISGERAIKADDNEALGHALYAAVLATDAADSRDDDLMDRAFNAIGSAEDRLAASDPLNQALAHALLGWAFSQDFLLRDDPNTLEQAVSNLEAAIDRFPNLALFHYELGTIYLTTYQDSTLARDELQNALTLDPTFSVAQAALGWLAYRDDQTDAAKQAFQQALQLNPKESLALFGLGRLALDDSDVEQALDYFQQTIDANPDFASAYAYLGETKLFIGFRKTDDETALDWYRQAEAAYRQALNYNDYDAFAYNGLGWILLYLDRYDEAIEVLQKALRLDNQNAEIFNGLGWSYFYSNRYSEATTFFQQAIDLNPYYIDAHFGLGRSYEEQGLLTEALAAFQTVKQLDPTYPTIDEVIARVSP